MRKIMITILFSVMVLIFGGSLLSAQATVICGDLSEADCAILTDSTEAMADLDSAGFDFTLDFTLEDLPSSPQSVTITLVGTGGYALNSDFALRAQTQMAAGDFAGMFESLFKSFNADADLILSVPQELAGSGQPNRVGLALRMVEGFAYVNLDKMSQALGSSTPAGWQGIDLASFYREFFEQQDLPAMNFMPDPEMVDQMSEFVTIERVADDTSGDQTLAVFQYTYDYGALFEGEFFANILQMQFETMGMTDLGVDQDELIQAYSELLADIELVMTQSIGVDDQLIHRMTLDMNWTLDIQAFAEAMDMSASDMGMSSFTLRMNMVADLDQFNEYPDIEEPEGATILPYTMLLPQ